jgi:solute carrier family 35 (UDP-sugar transporter), member A1/2/3
MHHNYESIVENGILSIYDGFTTSTWIVVLNGALNGITVSMIMKYADNIIKVFAFSLSMFTTTFASIAIFGIFPPFLFYVGLTLVSISLYMYNI